MNEKPIERMSYFNGQRLEADDFKVEQEYHMRVRRWLNKSLYSAGIASGLEVRADPGNLQQVIIGPGLALDNEGREIILLDEERISVVGTKSEKPGMVEGNYLFIQYREETRAEESEDCTPRRNGNNHGHMAWGGPSRVRAKPILGWSNAFPQESTGKIVLAQAELDPSCNLRHVYAYPRRYIAPASKLLVHQYALEGERHIDANNPGRIYFHIRGHQPNAVTLHLRAEKFSTLFYTELGRHLHQLLIDVNDVTFDTSHFHTLEQVLASDKDANGNLIEHSHLITAHTVADFGASNVKFDALSMGWRPGRDPVTQVINNRALYDSHTDDDLSGEPPSMKVSKGDHSHHMSGQMSKEGGKVDLSFSFSEKRELMAGVCDVQARNSNNCDDPTKPRETALTYVADLQVFIGKVATDGRRPTSAPNDDFTALILNHLKNALPGIYGTKTKLGEGNGDEDDPLAFYGTGPIPLDSLSNNLSFSEGQYYIELKVKDGGGRILYNLYVE